MTLRRALLESMGEVAQLRSCVALGAQQRNFSNDPTLNALLEAAMRRCDQFKDDDKARQDMREQVLETPPDQRQDLLDYFNGAPPP